MRKLAKIIGVVVVLVIVFFAVKTFLGSNEKAGTGSTIFSANEVAGTYKNVSLLQDAVLTLNDDDTYDANYRLERYSTFQYEDKGTFSPEDNGNLLIFDGEYDKIEFQRIADKYYYRTSDYEYEPNIDYYDDFCFATDTEYGKAPTFDENGRSNQSFTSIYEVSESVMYGSMQEENPEEKVLSLSLFDDGTFVLDNIISDSAEDAVNTTVRSASYQGTYNLDGEILSLKYDGGEMTFIYTDDKIYFDVYEKQE